MSLSCTLMLLEREESFLKTMVLTNHNKCLWYLPTTARVMVLTNHSTCYGTYQQQHVLWYLPTTARVIVLTNNSTCYGTYQQQHVLWYLPTTARIMVLTNHAHGTCHIVKKSCADTLYYLNYIVQSTQQHTCKIIV